MIVSTRKRFIFIHNPKCGGTSVRRALRAFDTTGDFFWLYDEKDGKTIDKAHLPLSILRDEYPDYFALFDDYFSFMFVRNPYSRIISAFNETRDALYATHDTEDGREGYVRSLNELIGGMTRDMVDGWTFDFRHFVRQVDFAYLGTKRYVDLVMKIEDYPQCLEALRLLRPDLALKLRGARHRNSRPMAGSFQDYLTPASIAIVNRIYERDFRIFGYEMIG